MREFTPTRSAAIELADERRLMRQGYEFLDEKRMLLATEMLRQLKRLSEALANELVAETKSASEALAAAVERHGLDQLQVYPVPEPPAVPDRDRTLLSRSWPCCRRASRRNRTVPAPTAIDPSPEAKACRAAFERLLSTAADVGRAHRQSDRLAREYRRTERRAKALENVLLPEVEEAIKRVDEQLDTMEREEVIRARWSR